MLLDWARLLLTECSNLVERSISTGDDSGFPISNVIDCEIGVPGSTFRL